MEKNEMGGACVTYGGERRGVYRGNLRAETFWKTQA